MVIGIDGVVFLFDAFISGFVFCELLDGVGGVGMEDCELLDDVEVFLEGGEDAAAAGYGIKGVVGGVGEGFLVEVGGGEGGRGLGDRIAENGGFFGGGGSLLFGGIFFSEDAVELGSVGVEFAGVL